MNKSSSDVSSPEKEVQAVKVEKGEKGDKEQREHSAGQEVAVKTGSEAAMPSANVAEVSPSHLLSPIREVERFFDRLWPRMLMRPLSLDWPSWGGIEELVKNVRVPPINVIDRDDDVLLHIELPGIEKKNIHLSVSDNVLVIKGSSSRRSESKEHDFVRREFAQQDFSRSLILPEGVNADKAVAHLKDGVLEVVLPKEKSLKRRAIEVQ